LWREHLGGRGGGSAAAPASAGAVHGGPAEVALDRFVVLNKIDALIDPLATPAEAHAQIERQREQVARMLEVPVARVFALSARDALAAGVSGDESLLRRSRLPELEAALAAELLPRRAELLAQAVLQTLRALGRAAARRLDDRRRQNAEQLLELRSLRGKGAAKKQLMVQRVEAEALAFEHCVVRLGALRAVHRRLLREMLAPLSTETLRNEVAAQRSVQGTLSLALGARKTFDTLFTRLRMALVEVRHHTEEMEQMLRAGFAQLNADFGFAFVLPSPPALSPYDEELALVERGYTRYTAWSQAWRLSVPSFADQFWRLLVSRLRRVFESATDDLRLWSQSAMAQVDLQLRERRRGFVHRREVLQRIAAATGDLDQRLAEVEAQDERLQALQRRLAAMAADTMAAACRPLAPDSVPPAMPQQAPDDALVHQDAA
ncbi:MAG TPA: dynamin family protein, partial [Rubrivivax sp.]|nr:dynamin family protein [Rubrivivax sp.]